MSEDYDRSEELRMYKYNLSFEIVSPAHIKQVLTGRKYKIFIFADAIVCVHVVLVRLAHRFILCP